ncbi:MAG: hypothetical protein HYV24_02740 [Deltaproteobacteria bacterium]|nr:hypothetical protein [Deltaproteobacteria bacterium]
MSIYVQQAETTYLDLRPVESSTTNMSATRGDVLKKMYLTNKPVVEQGSAEKIDQIGLRSESKPETDRVISLPSFKAVTEQAITPIALLQEWEGYVECINENEFTASLVDITKKKNIAEEEADFPIEDLNQDDKRLLKPGAVFRWLIGYRSIGGTKERFSKIVFRRMPQWTARDFEAARTKAKYISRTIVWE